MVSPLSRISEAMPSVMLPKMLKQAPSTPAAQKIARKRSTSPAIRMEMKPTNVTLAAKTRIARMVAAMVLARRESKASVPDFTPPAVAS